MPLKNVSTELALYTLVAFLLFLGIGEIPGLHGDEAWVILRVKEIALGRRVLDGMNEYTGGLHLYLLWPFFEGLGYSAQNLRIAGALACFAYFVLCMRIAKIIFPQSLALWLGLLLATSPAFVLFSRFSTEITTIVPLLSTLGIYFMVLAIQKKQPLLLFASGMALGLASFTHILAISIPLALFFTGLFFLPFTFWRDIRLRLFATGFLAGFLPRMISMIQSVKVWKGSGHVKHVLSGSKWSDLFALPKILCGIGDGNLLYQRFTGKNMLPVLPYCSVILLFLLTFRFFMREKILWKREERGFFVLLILLILTIFVMTPALSLRYFLSVFLILPFFIVLLLKSIMDDVPAMKKSIWIVLSLLIMLNLTYLSIDYAYAFTKTGGSASLFRLGGRLTETSNHFIRTDRLYRELVNNQVEVVLAKDFIIWPLQVYDLQRKQMQFEVVRLGSLPSLKPQWASKKIAWIHYHGAEPLDGKSFQPSQDDVLWVQAHRLKRNPTYDPNFLVFELAD